MHANSREEIKEVWAGDIAAGIGLKEVTTGETLCDDGTAFITLEKMDFPEPYFRCCGAPRSKADQDKMGVAPGKLVQEDPFRVKTDGEQVKQLYQVWVSYTLILLLIG